MEEALSTHRFICRVRPPYSERIQQTDHEVSNPEAIIRSYYGGQTFLTGALRQAFQIVLTGLSQRQSAMGCSDSMRKVVISDFNCSTMLGPILNAGLVPEFVDVDRNFHYHTQQLEEVVEKGGVLAVVLTHFFGENCWSPELKSWAEKTRRRGVCIIEDCAHSLLDQEQPDIGRVGDVALFSFGNDKPLSVGKGGGCVIRKQGLEYLSQLFDRIPIRDDGVERVLQLWHIVFSKLARPELCFAGLLCEVPNVTPPTREMFDDYLREIGSGKKCSLERQMIDIALSNGQNLYRKILRRVRKTFRRELWQNMDLSMPVRMGWRSRRLLEDYLLSDEFKKENLTRSLNHATLCKMLGWPKNDCGSRLRYTCVFEDEESAKQAVITAMRNGIEAGGFNWRPNLSDCLGVARQRPDWAVSPKRVVNFPIHSGVERRDLEVIAEIARSAVNFDEWLQAGRRAKEMRRRC